METFFFRLQEICKFARSVLTMFRIKLRIYRKTNLPSFDWKYLYRKWDCRDPNVFIDSNLKTTERDCDLSIIVPLYNSEEHLSNLIKMFQNQETDYKFELILVNDGSKDKTKNILAAVEHTTTFIKIINQANGGISKARNTGINLARGRYISFVDHDDEVLPDYVQKLMSVAYAENAEIVKCWYGLKFGNEIVKKGSSAGYIWAGVMDYSLFEHIRFPEGYWYEDMINNFVIMPQATKAIEIKDVLYFKVSLRTNASKIIWSSKNYKTLEHIYLVRALIVCYKKMGLKNKEHLFLRVLKECSSLAVNRTKGLDFETRIQVFQACCEMLDGVWEDKFTENLGGKDKIFLKALRKKDFSLWNIAARL